MMKINNNTINQLIKKIDPDLIDDDLLDWFKVLTNSSMVTLTNYYYDYYDLL